MARLEFTMTQEKQTKNTVVYKTGPGSGAPMDTVYIQKSQLTQEGQKGYPQEIRVTFEF